MMMNVKRFLSVLAVLYCMAALQAAAKMDPRVNAVGAKLTEAVFEEPERNLGAVVSVLVKGTSGAARVKVLHDWICNNIAYDTDVFHRPISADEQDYASVLRKRKAICIGYTNLMCRMCELAGIEAIGIEGYSKGFGYRGYLGAKPDHAWNAVKIGSRWQLVDVTWDAGYCDWGVYIKRYSTEWLSRTPREFLYSHLPTDDDYQYYKPLVTKEQFVKEPYIPGKFFAMGFTLGKSVPDFANAIEGAVMYEFRLGKATTAVLGSLYCKDDGRSVVNALLAERMGGTITLDVDVPDGRRYCARLLANDRTEKLQPKFCTVAEFEENILPQAQRLFVEGKVTEEELELFAQSFMKVEDNGRYYFLEDQFDTVRNRAVDKVLTLLNNPFGNYDEVLSFDVVAAEDYEGYGLDVRRFPQFYSGYGNALNTRLVSPRKGALHGGDTELFGAESKDFTSFGIVLDGDITFFKKNAKTGIYELEFTVPEDIESITVMGSKDGRTYEGLWSYPVE